MSAAQRQIIDEDEFAMAHAHYDQLVEFLRSAEGRALDHAGLEVALTERGRELLRRLLQAQIHSRGLGTAVGPVQGADGVARGQQRVHDRGLSTVFGEVRIKRLSYGAPGVGSLHPLDADLKLPKEEYSLGVRRMAAQEATKASFDLTAAVLADRTGKTIGKRQLEQLVQRAAVDYDAFYAQQTPAANTVDMADRASRADTPSGPILVITVDGKGIVMTPQDLREPTRKAAQNEAETLDKHQHPGEKRHAKRMATVAAVYTVNPHVRTPEQVGRNLAPVNEPVAERPLVENKRVWASLMKPPQDVIEAGFQEALRRDPDRKKTWVGLVDGNAKQLAVLKALSKKHGVKMTIVMDVMHVAEYLWEASTAFYTSTSPQRATWVTARLNGVLNGRAGHVAGGMTRSATLRCLSAEERKPVDTAARYLKNHKQYLRYDRYLAAGLPIATGVIEGACRHLVCDRMDGPARWSLKGAEAVLAMRAIGCSDHFDEYWRYHLDQEYQRNHVSAYADGNVVPIRGRAAPVLRCVK